jgi:hypothetical protein
MRRTSIPWPAQKTAAIGVAAQLGRLGVGDAAGDGAGDEHRQQAQPVSEEFPKCRTLRANRNSQARSARSGTAGNSNWLPP